jgi:heme exporter protein A
MTLLSADGLAILRGGRLLVEGLSLRLEAGEGVQVTGPNGAGKSSLLRCLAGLLAPAAGTISRNAAVALADERLPLDPELPLESALRFWAKLDGTGQSAGSVLAALDLQPLADVPVRMLSSGQRKRASLALAAASGARLWLLDEPLNALDGASAARLDTLIADHRSRGGAVIVATHQPLGGDKWRSMVLGG